MHSWLRTAVLLATLAAPAVAFAQDAPPPTSPPGTETEPPPPDQGKEKPKEPGKGDFDAGGQVRLPNGPDENGDFKTFNWVAFDVKGRYFLLDSITLNGFIPLAVKKPSMLMDGTDPRMIGGMLVRMEAKLPKMNVPMAPKSKDTEIGVQLTGAYMREGAMGLSDKDYPLFAGKFQPGFNAGLIMKVKLGSILDFQTLPVWVYQHGSAESLQAVQIPVNLIVKLGSLLKVSADVGIYTGDDYTFRGSKGGRVALGAAIDVKIGPILTHLGAGAASLTTGGVYPTISDSIYFDLNVKYAK
jgi:hypothetical protein